MLRHKRRYRFLGTLAMLAFAFVAVASTLAAPYQAEESVLAAWQAARAGGRYRFAADVRQTTHPRASLVNVGRQSRVETVHLEGSADFEVQQMSFTLWSQGGNVLDPESGVQVRIDDSGAFARQGTGAWEPVPDFSAALAPDGDFLAYLEGARGIQEAERGRQGAVAFTRYTFQLNGPALADRMREQLQRQMTANGELPAGLALAAPELYARMTGSGELWLGQDGLPLRQRLSLEFPESEAQRVTADVDVSFSGFGEAHDVGATWGAAPERLRQTVLQQDMLQALASSTAIAALLAGAFVLLAGRRRSRLVSNAITITCLVALVGTPALQAAQAVAAETKLAARRAVQEEASSESAMQQRLRDFLAQPDAEQAAADNGTQIGLPRAAALKAPGAQGHDASEQVLLEGASVQTDADRDGLSDYQERLLGTNPFRADSDGDLLPDSWEVEGFEMGARRWVSDPLQLDSNRDGLSDTREWLTDADNDGIPDDTDGDGLPDLLDRDNDGDGAPDRLDISPFAASVTFTQNEPLGLTFNNLSARRPALVDFQLRPENADHLWYAFNVLDWPQGDAQGQMQDVDGHTFADSSGQNQMGPEANGDLRLVPMLEIEMKGPLTHLPSPGERAQMGMVLQTPRDAQGQMLPEQPKYVYLPLRLVTDPDTGAQVAFEGTMLYRPEFDLWGAAHRVRLAWLVQALVDVCVEVGTAGTECDARQNNQPQVLHVYYEPWQLTGLDVREDHGIELAILYEDPAVDPQLHDDDALMMLAGGLAQTFLAGRDADGDGQPDLTTAEIARRFGRGSEASANERWAIPDIVDVTRRTYEHRAQALATVVMTDTASILAETFSPHVESAGAITPTLMFAREERFRTVNLDSQVGSELVRWHGSNLTVDLDGGDAPLQTVTSLSWAPFRHSEEGQRWESFAIADYWELLAARYPFFEEADPETAAGKQFALQLFYLSLYAGASEPVQFDGELLPNLRAETDQALAATTLDYALNGVSYVVNGYVGFLLDVGSTIDGFTWSDWAKVKELVTKTDRELGVLVRDVKARFQSLSTFGKGAVIAALILLLAGLVLLTVFAHASLAARITLATVVGGLLLWLDVVSPMYSIIQGIRGLITAETGFFSATRAWLATSSGRSAVNAAKFAAVLALVITLIVVWVDFFVTINKHNFQAGSIPFNLLLSQAIAGTLIAALALALVFAFPIVGAIVVAIVGVWDLIMTIVGLEELVLTSQVTKFLADVFYGVNATIEQPSVTLQGRELSLVDPRLGVVAGNELSVAATVLTEIAHNRPRHNVILYRDSFYVPEVLSTTAFDYQLNAREEIAGQAWSAEPPWQLRRSERHLGAWLWRGERESQIPAARLPLEGAGINRAAPYTFKVRYDLPGWECWGVSAVSYCDERRIGGEDSSVDATIVLDVLPPTLEEFYSLDWGSWQPSWTCPPPPFSANYVYWQALGGQCEYGLSFAVQRDHDGDGLLAQALGGLDSDDSRWDSDGDGLSDRFELESAQESQGLALHLSADSDGDGLCDDQEFLAGSDPGLADSDGDGLLDGEEVLHQDRCDADGDGDTTEWMGGWTFVYGVPGDAASQAAGVLISSNPRQADGDGDGLSDRVEKELHERNPLLYPYHPAVANETPVALYSLLSDDDRILAPGQTVIYTATVRNTLSLPLASAGTFTATLPGVLGGERVTESFNLYRAQEQTLTRSLQVAADATSGAADIGQQVDARLHNGDLNPLFSWQAPRIVSHELAGDLPLISLSAEGAGRSWVAPLQVAALRGRDAVGACGGTIACSTAAIELLSLQASGQVSATTTVDAFQDFAYPLSGKQPDLAFNAEGVGLLVYARPHCEEPDCQAQQAVFGALLTPGQEDAVAPFVISTAGDAAAGKAENIQVTADAAGFLVVWEELDAEGARSLRAARVTTSGLVTPAPLPEINAPQRLLDVAWSGERYLLAWSTPETGETGTLRVTALEGEDALQISAEYELARSLAEPVEAQIAAENAANRALLVYASEGEPVRAQLLNAGSLPAAQTLGEREAVTAPRVTYDARSQGWLLSWLATGDDGEEALHYQALDSAGRPRLAAQTQTIPGAAGATLVCGEQAGGCLGAVQGSNTLHLLTLALEPLATAIDRPLSIVVDAGAPTSTIMSLQNGQYISTTGELVIGGIAADTTSRVAGVEVRVNDQPCREVAGAAVWAATCQLPEADGPFTISARASDLVGNVQSEASRITVIVDRAGPQVEVSQSAPAQPVAAEVAGEGLWLLALDGRAVDLPSGAAPGSGVAQVEARLHWDRSWQTAEIEGNAWRLHYRLPLFDQAFNVLGDPTGIYRFALRAVDHAGNSTALPELVVSVDNQPPAATLSSPAQINGVISQTVSLTGRLTETGPIQSGVSGLTYALTPANFVISPTTWLPAELAQSGSGVISSTWRATVPAGLEGIYRLDVRGEDVLGNRNDERSSWNQWQGEIDTLAPRTAVTVTHSGVGSSAQTTYELWAEDFNLASTNFASVCPEAAVENHTYSEPWWDETIRDRTRLYVQSAGCRVTGLQTAVVTVEACDRFGRCTLDSQSEDAGLPGVTQAPLLHSAVITPAQQTTLADDVPTELVIGAHAADGLAAATLLVDGAPLASRRWDDSPPDEQWTVTWQPPGEGNYWFTSIVTDTAGRVQTETVSTLVSIDLSAPQVGLTTTVVTATQRLAAGRVDLTGMAHDAIGVAAVEVQIDGGPWLPAVLHGEEWILPWKIGADLDGESFAVAVRAIDGAGRMDELQRQVVVDVLPPAAGNLTLATGSNALSPGDTVRETSAALTMRWAAGSDGAGVASYLAGWSVNPHAGAAELTAYATAGQHEQTVAEPQAIYAHLLVSDEHGNVTRLRRGPIVIDGAGTPDYVADLSYDGWHDDETTLVGMDWAASRRAVTGAGIGPEQRLYASWDTAGLRLTWAGAQWNRDGDLFVYLDTAGGGARQLLNPYRGINPAITLPENLSADFVVQVEDSRGASIWRWDGAAWMPFAELSGDLFIHDTGTQPARTDFYLPFDLLDIGDPAASSLQLLAVASEEEALRLWATIPDKNPLNSERAIAATAVPFTRDDFQLTQALGWPALGQGQMPNGGLPAGADLQLTITADPPGAAFSYLQSGLPQLQPGERLDEGMDGILHTSLPLDTEAAPLADGTVVTYTIAYANHGEASARDVQIEVAAHGALIIPESQPQAISLGDVSPGITGTVVLTASINVSRTQNIASAELDVTVSDLTHGAFDWLWVQHDVDASPPEVRVTAPQGAVVPGELIFEGTVDGPAAVGDVIVAVRSWLPGAEALSFCSEMVVDGRHWTCTWAPGEAYLDELAATRFDGAALQVQARATDVFERRSAWSPPLALVVDGEAPALLLSAETESYLVDGFLNATELNLTGVISDSQQAGQLQVCIEGQACERVATVEGAWHVTISSDEEADGQAQRMTLQGFDSVGNASELLVLDYQVDARAPEVSITEQLTTTVQTTAVTAVLTGTVRESPEPPTLTLRILPPSGVMRVEQLVVQEQGWQFAFAPDTVGRYQLVVEAEDRAGNLRVMPARSLLVTGVVPPPVAQRPPPLASTQLATTWTPPLKAGSFIRLVVEPALPEVWSQVQWRDAAGDWHDVDGWRGAYYRGNEVLWWVSERELATGPYRWVLMEGPGGPLLAYSAAFMAPAERGKMLTVRVALPDGADSRR